MMPGRTCLSASRTQPGASTVSPQGAGAVVEYAILGEKCRIGRGCRVGGTPESTPPEKWGLTVLAPGCTLEDGKEIRPGVMLGKNGEEVSR